MPSLWHRNPCPFDCLAVHSGCLVGVMRSLGKRVLAVSGTSRLPLVCFAARPSALPQIVFPVVLKYYYSSFPIPVNLLPVPNHRVLELCGHARKYDPALSILLQVMLGSDSQKLAHVVSLTVFLVYTSFSPVSLFLSLVLSSIYRSDIFY